MEQNELGTRIAWVGELALTSLQQHALDCWLLLSLQSLIGMRLYSRVFRHLTDITQWDHRKCVWSKLFGIEYPILSSRPIPQTSSLHLLQAVRPHLHPLYRHLPNRKLHRHGILHSPQHSNHLHDSRHRQIRSNLLRQPLPLPLEGHAFHPPLQYHRSSPTSTRILRPLHSPRLPHNLRLLQPPAAARTENPYAPAS